MHDDTDPYNLQGRRARLLLVDDQPGNIHLLHGIFGAEHNVFLATDGEQALRQCDAAPPDLVLLDVQMPGLSGLEVCRLLKQSPATRGVPVIFVTGNEGTAAEMACWEAGGVDFVTKPVNALTLRNRVNTHLALKFQADALRELAYLDALTGVANRRHFDQRLATAWQGALRDDRALALIMIDVDFFKRYNDHYGHQAGDDCLRRVATVLGQQLKRPHDLLARYGGEEFICLLPGTDLAGATAVAHALGQAVRDEEIVHAEAGASACLSISLGVAASLPRLLPDPDALLRQADTQLYLAKRDGRDRVRAGPTT